MPPPAEVRASSILFGIQHLRGIAALLVLVRHISVFTYPDHPFPIGQCGVDIFFVISGVVIYLTGRTLTWHVFLRRRIARIAPLYWLMTAIALIATVAARPGETHDATNWANTIGSFLFIPAFDADGVAYPPIVVGWTLNFEMYYYVVCTFVLALSWRTHFVSVVSGIIIAGSVLGGMLFWLRPGDPVWAPLYLLLPITIEFVGGLWLAKLWSDGIRTPLWANALLVMAAITWLLLAPTSRPYSPVRPLGWGIPALAIVWATLASERQIAFDRFRPGLLIGDASYAIYLTHPIALAAGFTMLSRLTIHLPAPLALPLAALGCIGVGILAHRFVERPLVRGVARIMGLVR